MRISHSSYSNYIEKISANVIEESLNSPLLLNYKTVVFPFSNLTKQILVIDLNSKMPITFMTTNDCFFSSFENKFIQKLKKHLGRSTIKSIRLKKDDLILTIELESGDDFETYFLVIQLIPNNPNLFLLDKNKYLIEMMFSSKVETHEKNSPFIYPVNKDFYDGETAVEEKLIQAIIYKEYEIRLSEKFSEFSKYLNSKIKNAKRKIDVIQKDKENAGNSLIYQEIADSILCSQISLKSHQDSFDFNGKSIPLNSAKSLLENAQHFYKKARKAKETILLADENIKNAEIELEKFSQIKEEFEIGNEAEKDKLVRLYSVSKNKKETKPTFLNKPWKVNFNGTIIYFGRNSFQNDYLSFAMKLDREFTWLHIKDKSGAHLVIANKKPTENELLTAAELSLLCSRTNAGEISYTKKKNVRRGHKSGEAILKNYTTLKINNIRKETIELFNKAVRCD